MREHIGIACHHCDALNALDAVSCKACGAAFSLKQAGEGEVRSMTAAHRSRSDGVAPEAIKGKQSEKIDMRQAPHYSCSSCAAPVTLGQQFCPSCGTATPEFVRQREPKFFGAMQDARRARLVLIRGVGGKSGTNYMLQGASHRLGRKGADIAFPDDQALDNVHASFYYSNGQLMVRDEDSVNGVYIRIQKEALIAVGAQWIAGEQLFRLDPAPPEPRLQDRQQDTYFYASPMWQADFRIVQLLNNGTEGAVFCSRDGRVEIGRGRSDMVFPSDIYMSGQHAVVERRENGEIYLVDNDSKNGTYLRANGERAINHGDYVFVGQQLLRVERNS